MLLALTSVASAQTIQLNVGKLTLNLVNRHGTLVTTLSVYSHALRFILGWGLGLYMCAYGTADFYYQPLNWFYWLGYTNSKLQKDQIPTNLGLWSLGMNSCCSFSLHLREPHRYVQNTSYDIHCEHPYTHPTALDCFEQCTLKKFSTSTVSSIFQALSSKVQTPVKREPSGRAFKQLTRSCLNYDSVSHRR